MDERDEYERAVSTLLEAAVKACDVPDDEELDALRDAVTAVYRAMGPEPGPAHPSSPTVRVRIAVAVAPDGRWAAYGDSTEGPEYAMRSAWSAVWTGEHPEPSIRWVEADVPISQVTVEGEVSDG